MHSNKRKLNMMLFLAACIFVSVAATKPSTTTSTASEKVPVSDTGMWKNLKVLPKDISKDSLDHVMHGFTKALGVKCNFCHANNNGKMDFASDDKEEKNIARYMMNMTTGINKTYFNSENSTQADTISVVKCFTCHHGNPHPDEAGMEMNNNGNMQAPAPPPHDSSSQPSPANQK